MCTRTAAFHNNTGTDNKTTSSIPGPTIFAGLLESDDLEVAKKQIPDKYRSPSWSSDGALTQKEFGAHANRVGYVSDDVGSIISTPHNQAGTQAENLETLEAVTVDGKQLDRHAFEHLEGEGLSFIKIEELTSHELSEEAIHMWKLVRTEDHSHIQTLANKEFRLHRSSYSNHLQHSEEQIRTEWLKKSFSHLLNRWLCDDILTTNSFRHHFTEQQFIPLVFVASMSVLQVDAGTKALSRLQKMIYGFHSKANYAHQFLRIFNKRLWLQWATVENVAQYLPPSEKQKIFIDTVLHQYYMCMNMALDEMQTVIPCVTVPPHVGAKDETEIQQRKEMLKHMNIDMFDAVEAEVARKWHARLNRLPKSIHSRFSSHPPHFLWPPNTILQYRPSLLSPSKQKL